MALMKIENYEGTLDTFTFPYNPQSFDDSMEPNYKLKEFPYAKYAILISGGGIRPRPIVLAGHFSSTDKNTDYEELSKHFSETTKLKKLYFKSDRFYLGTGGQLKQTNSGERQNFVDYVGTFNTIFGILFGDTKKTTGTNSGNIETFVEEITGVYDGSGDLTITDSTGVQVKVSESKFSGNSYFRYKQIKMVSAGGQLLISKLPYFEVDDNSSFTSPTEVTIATGKILKLQTGEGPGALTFANVTGTPTVKFRDGWTA